LLQVAILYVKQLFGTLTCTFEKTITLDAISLATFCVYPMIVIVNLKDILVYGILPYPSPKPMHIILHNETIIA